MASTSSEASIPTSGTRVYTLITYFRSSCSARLRIALALKSIPYDSVYVNLLKGEQHSSANTNHNPSHSVPTLIPSTSSDPPSNEFKITQSLSALEYLDELHPSPPLLPQDPQHRAVVRSLSNIIACDIQPVTNLRILERISALTPGSAEEKAAARAKWAKELMTDGLLAYEAIASQWAGKYSVGYEVTMADCCLVPAVWGAERVGVDFDALPTVRRIAEAMEELDAVKKAHWKSQKDTPEGLR